jgi:hypothetical protein
MSMGFDAPYGWISDPVYSTSSVSLPQCCTRTPQGRGNNNRGSRDHRPRVHKNPTCIPCMR